MASPTAGKEGPSAMFPEGRDPELPLAPLLCMRVIILGRKLRTLAVQK